MTEADPARQPRSLLSRAPRTEPVLEVRSGSVDNPGGPVTSLHAPRRGPHSGRRARAPLPEPKTVDLVGVDGIAAARRFAEHALRLVLEVLDRRRPPEHLRAVAEPALIDMVRVVSLGGAPGGGLGAARLRRIHLQPASPRIVEVYGNYERGPRMLAVAARIVAGKKPPHAWRIEALHIA